MTAAQTNSLPRWIAFVGTERLALGSPVEVATQAKALIDANPLAALLILDASSSQPIELDLRGSLASVLACLPCEPSSHQTPPSPADVVCKPGRPRLGVVAREVTLLPRHWDWLSKQPGGASVALRKLVEQTMRAKHDEEQIRLARESAYRFMVTLAGNAPGFEAATRALFAGDISQLQLVIADWPADVQEQVLNLVCSEFASTATVG